MHLCALLDEMQGPDFHVQLQLLYCIYESRYSNPLYFNIKLLERSKKELTKAYTTDCSVIFLTNSTYLTLGSNTLTTWQASANCELGPADGLKVKEMINGNNYKILWNL